MQETTQTSESSGGNKFTVLVFAIVALGAILYCLGEIEPNYQSARYEYLFGNRYNSYGYSSYSNSGDYYRYKGEMEDFTMIAGGAALVGIIAGFRRRKEGGLVRIGFIGSLIAAALAAYTAVEYNLF
jgi:hypothetical protein